LGSAEITHPFHPLHGQRFSVLKIRRVSGVPTLSMRHPDLGSFAVPQEWTDRGAPQEPTGTPLLVDAFGLSELAMIVDFLTRGSTRG
jgi:hypothetical protein